MSMITNIMEIDMGMQYTTRLKAYMQFSRLVRERDGHMCRMCGSDDGVKAYRINIEKDTTFSYSADNGISLCQSCRDEARDAAAGFTNVDLLAAIAEDDKRKSEDKPKA